MFLFVCLFLCVQLQAYLELDCIINQSKTENKKAAKQPTGMLTERPLLGYTLEHALVLFKNLLKL